MAQLGLLLAIAFILMYFLFHKKAPETADAEQAQRESDPVLPNSKK